MAQLPSIEESEHFILGIYKQMGIRANEMLAYGVFLSVLQKQSKFREDDLQAGLKSLIQKGMIIEKERKYFLTASGFEAI
ncbi:MAG: hypothetical protein ABR913_05915 [Sedimentisphaerales bacterium]|jgi:hypothetical protein